MNLFRSRAARRALVPAAALALAAGCRDRATRTDDALASDSSLARDLALAQRDAAGPTVFNDAPAGATTPAGPAPAAPDRRPAPPRIAAPAPRPVPRRASPPAPIARTPAPAAGETAPAPTPGRAVGVIGAGTSVGMTTNGKVCAANTLAGDKYTATVTSATTGSNGAVIPAGATVVLEVASVDRADPIESSRITFRVRAVDVDGVPRPVEGEVATLGALEPVRTAAGNTRNGAIGGAVAGAVLGRILGRSTKATVLGGIAGAATGTMASRRTQVTDACLPDGAPLRLTLARDMVVAQGAP